MRSERLDINKAECSGEIKKIWSSEENDVYVRIEDFQKRNVLLRLTEHFPTLEGFRLSKGDWIHTCGYLADFSTRDSLSKYFVKFGREKFLQEIPELNDLVSADSRIDKHNMAVVPTKIVHISEPFDMNNATVEGVVLNKWKYRDQQFLKLYCFDSYTPVAYVTEEGLTKRIPHLLFVTLSDDLYQAVNVKQRVRITGEVSEFTSHESLKRSLAAIKKLDIMSQTPQEVLAFSVSVQVLYLHAKSVIIFS